MTAHSLRLVPSASLSTDRVLIGETKTMAKKATFFSGRPETEPPADLLMAMGAEVAAYLRRIWPTNTAKRAARFFRVAVATAKNWLAGCMPSKKHFAEMLFCFGPDFAARVLSPCGDWAADLAASAEELDARIAECERLIAALKHARRRR